MTVPEHDTPGGIISRSFALSVRYEKTLSSARSLCAQRPPVDARLCVKTDDVGVRGSAGFDASANSFLGPIFSAPVLRAACLLDNTALSSSRT